jgi:hypothetical protein
MIESGFSIWALANPNLTPLLGQSSIDVAQKVYSAFYFSFLPKEPTLPAIVLDRMRSKEADDTLDARTPAPTVLEGSFQFGCVAQDAPVGSGAGKNPQNPSGYLTAVQLSTTLREQLLGLATGNSVLPDGTVIDDLWIIDEFDAHFEVGGMGYLYRRVLQVGALFKETGIPPVPTGGGTVTRYSLTPAPDGVTVNFTTTPVAVVISPNAILARNGMIQSSPSDYSASGTMIAFAAAPGAGDTLALFQ